MKIACVADVHLGNFHKLGGDTIAGLNQRCRHTIATLREAIHVAEQRGCKDFIVVGDLFDNEAPSPNLLATVQIMFKATDMAVHVLLGNHDRASSEKGHHALAALWQVAHIIDTPEKMALGNMELVCIPYRATPTKQWFGDTVSMVLTSHRPRYASEKCTTRVLLMHLGIEDADTDRWLKGARDAVHVNALEELVPDPFDFILAGHWHDEETWEAAAGRAIVQIGALNPTGWDNIGPTFGRMAILDTKDHSVSFEHLPGVRFLKVDWMTVDWQKVAEVYKHDALYLVVEARPDEMDKAVQALRGAKAEGLIADGDVVPHVGASRRKAAKAAKAAREADTLAGAVDGFVKAMPLPGEVKRENVRERVLGYLGGR
jgi:DNA repair exonuclease SbcCD nuclease subunit